MARLRSAVIVAAAVGYLAIALISTALSEPLPPFPWDPFWLSLAGFPVVGALILVRRPGNNIGRILLAIGVCGAIANAATMMILSGWPGPDVLAMIGQIAVMPLAVLIPCLILLFPTAEVPSPRWVRAIGVAWGALVLLIGWYVVRPLPNPVTEDLWYPNPLGIQALAPVGPWVEGIAASVLVVFALATLVHSIRSYRRGSTVERHQVKWVISAALSAVALWVAGALLEGQLLWLGNALVACAFLLGGNAVAAAIGVAVFKYHLFDIDRLVSRTVSYALVVGLLAAGVAGVAALVGSRFQEPWLVAATTLAVAAVFNPLRQRLQIWVDRRFNRSRYDAEQVMDHFAGSLRDRVDPDWVVDGWLGVVQDTMQPSTVGVWVRDL